MNDYDSEDYTIEIWESLEDREMGNGFIHDFFKDFDSALIEARRLFRKNNYASIEILNKNEETVYCCDGISELFDFEKESISKVSNDILELYVNNWHNKKKLPIEEKKFYAFNGTVYVAVDNLYNNCLLKDFVSEKDAQNWLLDIEKDEIVLGG